MLDCRMLDWGGVGTYTKNLLLGMLLTSRAFHITCLAGPEQRAVLDPAIAGDDRVDVIETILPVASLKGLVLTAKIVERSGVDLFHAPHFIFPPFLRVPGVVTIHDLIPMIFPGAVELLTKLKYVPMVRSAVRRAERIIAVSGSTADDLSRHLGVRPSKITTIWEAVDRDILEEIDSKKNGETVPVSFPVTLPEQFLLYVGAFKPHKNVEGLMTAYSLLPSELRRRFPLVMVGREDLRYLDTTALSGKLGIREDVKRIAFADISQLVELYRRAAILLIPSLYEGFGLPALEAMACGTAVIASNVSSFPELIEGCARLVDPKDPGELSKAIRELLDDDDLRKTLAAAGKARAGQFSWRTAAEATLDVYDEVLSRRT